MVIKQISVFIENKKGRLADVTSVLANENINIKALSLADTSDFGILRMIVDEIEKAIYSLKQAGFIVKETDVLAVEVEDKPGGLNSILQKFKEYNIDIAYMYAFVESLNSNALLVFKVSDIDKAIKVLNQE